MKCKDQRMQRPFVTRTRSETRRKTKKSLSLAQKKEQLQRPADHRYFRRSGIPARQTKSRRARSVKEQLKNSHIWAKSAHPTLVSKVDNRSKFDIPSLSREDQVIIRYYHLIASKLVSLWSPSSLISSLFYSSAHGCHNTYDPRLSTTLV